MKLTQRMSNHVLVLIFCAALLIGLNWQKVSRTATYAYEDTVLALQPSAQLAFELGNKHFRASDASSYDVERAKYLYFKAIELDVDHPMVLQQIARTSFVEGNIDGALTQINLQLDKHPDSNMSAYYIRALVYGYQKRYAEAALDYERVIAMDQTRWPAFNDLAWTYLQSDRPADALSAINRGLAIAPDNAWMLTMKAGILYELGRYQEAYDSILRGVEASKSVTTEEWVAMYPGNNPASIDDGIRELQQAAAENLTKIRLKLSSTTPAVQ